MFKNQKQRYLDKNIETIGYLDIETKTEGFKAQQGYIISWVLKIVNLKTNKNTTWEMILNQEQKISDDPKKFFDKELLPELINKMTLCDMIVTHYGTWFDIPFIRTRCQMQRIPFISRIHNIRFADTWKMARIGGSYRRNSLDNVARTLGIKLHKTRVDYKEWDLATEGNKKAFKYILKHNEVDVLVTEKVFNLLESTFPVAARYY